MYQIIFFRQTLRVCTVLVAFTLSFHIHAQHTQRVDSLLWQLKIASEKEQINVLIELAREYFDADYGRALEYSIRAHEWALAHSDSLQVVRTGRIMGQLYNRMDKPREALNILSFVLPIAQHNNHREEQKRILNNLALAHTILAQYDKALDYHFQTLIMREEDGDIKEIAVSLNNIGLVYFKLRNYPKALEFYTKALQYREKSEDKSFTGQQLINIGLCHNQLKNFGEAFINFQRAFETCGDKCSDEVIIVGRFGMGVAYFSMEKYEDAIRYFNESLKVSMTINNKRYEAENQVYLGKVYIALDKPKEAEEALKQAERLASENAYNELLIDTYRQFSLLYSRNNDHEKTSFYQQKYIQLKDSVYSERLIDRIAELQTNFAERQNLATIAAKEEVIKRQRLLNLTIGIIAVLAALLVFVLYHSNRVVRRVNIALSEAKAELQVLNKDLDQKVKEKTASLQQVNEELDNFIYKTSHDIRGPLASLKGICNLALMEVKDPTSLDYLKKLDATADKLNKILTRLLIVNRVNHAVLLFEPVNFGELVDEIILAESKRGLPPRFIIKKEIEKTMSFTSDKELIRIILENLIDNAIKFYNDSERVDPFARIKITQTADVIEVEVIDNGVGITLANPDKVFQMFTRASERSDTGGIGLYLSKLAAERLGGSIKLATTTEGYTQFTVVFPLNNPAG